MSATARVMLVGACTCARALVYTCVATSFLATGCARSEPNRDSSPTPASSASAASSTQPTAVVAPSPSPSASSSATSSSSSSFSSKPTCITPASVGVERLVAAKGASADETAALTAARAELQRLLQVPSEFYVGVQSVGGLVLLELWHEAAFGSENCGKMGNPGEKSRTLGYDVHRRRIVSSKIWQ